MRTFMDNYYRFDPEYSAMSDAEKDAFVARYNMNQGGIARLNLRKGSGDELPPDPTTPVNPFKPKPIGPVLPSKAEGVLSFEEYFQGKQKFMREQSLEDMIREYEDYLERMSMKRDMVAKGGIARLGYQTGDLVDPRMRRSLAENVREQKAAREMNRKTRLERFAKHGVVAEAMAGKTGRGVIPQYGLQTGADFQIKFPEINPKVSAVLASGYQVAQEGARALNPVALAKSPLPTSLEAALRLKKGMKTAQEQATQNIEGILAADTGTLTAQQMEDRNRYLASQGQPTEPVLQDGENLIPGFTKVAGGYQGPDGQIYGPETYASIAAGMYPNIYDPRKDAAKGGMMDVPVRTNSEGVKELDYRKTGGFVPIGVKEKADDVPAMLSKNEFVFTADAVRGAGNGSIKKGAQRMYDTMKKLESRVV